MKINIFQISTLLMFNSKAYELPSKVRTGYNAAVMIPALVVLVSHFILKNNYQKCKKAYVIVALIAISYFILINIAISKNINGWFDENGSISKDDIINQLQIKVINLTQQLKDANALEKIQTTLEAKDDAIKEIQATIEMLKAVNNTISTDIQENKKLKAICEKLNIEDYNNTESVIREINLQLEVVKVSDEAAEKIDTIKLRTAIEKTQVVVVESLITKKIYIELVKLFENKLIFQANFSNLKATFDETQAAKEVAKQKMKVIQERLKR